jgi:hypothetical protein
MINKIIILLSLLYLVLINVSCNKLTAQSENNTEVKKDSLQLLKQNLYVKNEILFSKQKVSENNIVNANLELKKINKKQ